MDPDYPDEHPWPAEAPDPLCTTCGQETSTCECSSVEDDDALLLAVDELARESLADRP